MTLSVGSRVELNLSLEIGALAETVTVSADVSLLETSNATLGRVVGTEEVRSLPINHGDVDNLIRLGTGVGFTDEAGKDHERLSRWGIFASPVVAEQNHCGQRPVTSVHQADFDRIRAFTAMTRRTIMSLMLVAQDIFFGLRMLRKSPGFTAVAILALALGIGANATVFTIANAYLFRNLPFADSERVLYVSSVNGKTGRGRGVSYPDYRDFAAARSLFRGVGVFVRRRNRSQR